MERMYYINHKIFEKGDTCSALSFALKLRNQDQSITTITLLVPQRDNYSDFLEELGVSVKQCAKHIIPNRWGVALQVHTVKTYNPGYIMEGNNSRELLISIGVPPKSLEAFLDKSKIKYWVIVPWLIGENEELLRINEAIDIKTGRAIMPNYRLDEKVKNAIEWLKSTSFPNEGFNHPNDKDRLKQMSNALSFYKIQIDKEAIIHYCINNGILYKSAYMIADYFSRAQGRKFATDKDIDYKFLGDMMNRSR